MVAGDQRARQPPKLREVVAVVVSRVSSRARCCKTRNFWRGGESLRLCALPVAAMDGAKFSESGRMASGGTGVLALAAAAGSQCDQKCFGELLASVSVFMAPNCCRSVHGLAITAPCALYMRYSDLGVASPGFESMDLHSTLPARALATFWQKEQKEVRYQQHTEMRCVTHISPPC